MSLKKEASQQGDSTGIELADLLEAVVGTTSVISPVVISRPFKLTFPQAAEVLERLASDGYLEVLPESGIVQTYKVTPRGYTTAETLRGKKSFLGGLLQRS